jgi:plasmid stabilization system protein ParE
VSERRIRFEQEANEDLEKGVIYYRDEAGGEEVALRFVGAVEAACDLLLRHPEAARRYETAVHPRLRDVQAELDARPSVALTPQPDGRAVIETSTVIFGKDGRPRVGIAVGRLADRTRCLATTRSGDATTLERLLGAADPLGAVIAVTAGDKARIVSSSTRSGSSACLSLFIRDK